MKRWGPILLLGFILGYWIARREPAPAPVAPPSPRKSSPSASSTDSVVTESVTTRAPQLAMPLARAAPPASAEPSVARKQAMSFDVTEEMLRPLEDNWADLHNQAYTVWHDNGWNIYFMSDNSAFTGLGLKNGDFIESEALSEQMNDPQQAELVGRLMKAFRHIEK